jgi:hypothetical protein
MHEREGQQKGKRYRCFFHLFIICNKSIIPKLISSASPF